MISRPPVRFGITFLFLLVNVIAFAQCTTDECHSGNYTVNWRGDDIDNSLTISGNLNVRGTLNIYDTLIVHGSITSSFGGNISIHNGGVLIANNGLETGYLAAFTVYPGGTVDVTGDLNMGALAAMDIQGEMTVTGNLSSTSWADISLSNGGNLQVNGDLNNNQDSNITVGDASSLQVGGTFYNNEDGSLTIEDGGTVTAGNYNNEDGGTCTGSLCEILPVDLISFKASVSPKGVVTLTWSTATEINNEGFYVQKAPALSTELAWENIRFVEGNGNKETLSTYTCTDDNLAEDAYYRLKQVDFDGAFEYHDMIFVACPVPTDLAVYPNPFTEQLHLKLASGVYDTSLRDLNGREYFYTSQQSASELKAEIEAISTQLKTGSYLLVIRKGEEVHTRRIVKK